MIGLSRIKRRWRWEQKKHRQRRAERAVRRFPLVRKPASSGLPGELVVSLTSYPPRFPVLAMTVKSLLDQTVAHRTILWIANKDLPALPDDVRALERHGLEIRGCEDLLSYKKLIPCLAAFPDAFIVTADDDVYYPRHWLKQLVASYDPSDPAVVAGRAHLLRWRDDGSALPYTEWEFDTPRTRATEPRTALFPTGCGGVLYPPRSLPPEVMDESAFLELCRHGDDIWFFHMQRAAGMKQVKVAKPFRLVSWDSSQDSALWLSNLSQGQNDVQIRAVEQRYGTFGAPCPV